MAQQRLKKSHNQWIGGVLGGIANYFEINPDILRIAFLVLVILMDFGFLIPAYILMLILLPEPDEGDNGEKVTRNSANSWRILGILMIIAGVAFLLENQFGFLWVRFRHYLFELRHFLPPRDVVVALILVGGGLWLVTKKK